MPRIRKKITGQRLKQSVASYKITSKSAETLLTSIVIPYITHLHFHGKGERDIKAQTETIKPE